jgi:hypothetical protein
VLTLYIVTCTHGDTHTTHHLTVWLSIYKMHEIVILRAYILGLITSLFPSPYPAGELSQLMGTVYCFKSVFLVTWRSLKWRSPLIDILQLFLSQGWETIEGLLRARHLQRKPWCLSVLPDPPPWVVLPFRSYVKTPRTTHSRQGPVCRPRSSGPRLPATLGEWEVVWRNWRWPLRQFWLQRPSTEAFFCGWHPDWTLAQPWESHAEGGRVKTGKS